jgi:hypothetical protein
VGRRTSNQDRPQAPTPFTKNIIEQMPASLSGATVRPMADGYYNGSIHPFFVGDMALDSANNSIVDIWKHTDAGQLKLEALDRRERGRNRPTKSSPLRRPLAAVDQPDADRQLAGAGLTGVSTYLAGADAIVFVNFPNKRHTKIDRKWQNMNLWAGEYKERTAYDPNGLIMAGTGYNCVLGVGLPPDATSRARIAIAVPQTT